MIELDRGRLTSYPGNFSAYRSRKAEQRAQETGEGTYAWPLEMDPENPTGVEWDRPVPGPAAPLIYEL